MRNVQITQLEFEKNVEKYIDMAQERVIFIEGKYVLLPVEEYVRLSRGGTEAFNPQVEGSTPS